MLKVHERVRLSLALMMLASCAGAPQTSAVRETAEVVELPPPPAQPSASASSPGWEGTATQLTAQSVEDFLRQRFEPLVKSGMLELSYPSEGSDDELLEELACFRLTSTADLAALVPSDFERRGVPVLAELPAPAANTLSLLRDLMIIKDARHYFRKCWRAHFTAGPNEFPLPNAYGVSQQLLTELLTGDPTLGD